MAAEDAASADPPRPSGNAESQQWAIQRRIDDVFAKLGEKFGNLTGRVVAQMKPETTFAQIGGLREAKSIVRSFGTALTDPELYRKWGITPPKGVLLYGPPGTGKSPARPRPRHRDGGRLLSPEAHEPDLQVRSQHRRGSPGDPRRGQGAGAGRGLSRRGQCALPRASAPARPGSGSIGAAGGRPVREARRARGFLAHGRGGLHEPHRLRRLVAGGSPPPRPARRGAAARWAGPAGNPRPRPPAGGDGRPASPLRRHRLPLGAPAHGRHERSGDLRDRGAGPRAEGACGGQGLDNGLVTTQDLLQQIDAYRRIREMVEKIRYGQYL